MIAKKGLETGEDCDAVPESMRQYLALHLDPSKVHARNMFQRSTGYAMGGSSASGKISTFFVLSFSVWWSVCPYR
jgi:hypothetical protein